MSRFWSSNKRNGLVVASAVAFLGLVGYLAYEIYQETSNQDDEQQTGRLLAGEQDDEEPVVEDVINIADQLGLNYHDNTPQAQHHQQRSMHPLLPAVGSPMGSRSQQRMRMLAISARGIFIDGNGPGKDRWSADIQVRPSAVTQLRHLSTRYAVYLVVVVESPEDEQKVRAALERAGVVEPQLQQQSSMAGSATMDSIGQSLVWVDKPDYLSASSFSADHISRASSMASEAASSEVSAILAASSSTSPSLLCPSPPAFGNSTSGTSSRPLLLSAALPADNLLFCQTEEGKSHLVRHLLTLPGSTKYARNSLYNGYAGYIDTNRDVVARLEQVLHGVVLVDPDNSSSDFSGHSHIIDHGDVPGSQTAFSNTAAAIASSSSGSNSSGNIPPATTVPASLDSVERVKDIAECSFYRQ
ncbi:hypothetical protein GGI07_004279 [Coemansia sp. Benny D115]|nr:hypothetical protein GGI07_004279 [Coemansia sp. Benny D115]